MNEFKISAEWIDRIFHRLLEIYGDKFSSRFINPTYLENEKLRWQSGLSGVTSEEIRKVIELCNSGRIHYPPTVIEFYHYCKNLRQPLEIKKVDYERTEEQQRSGERHIKEILEKLKGKINATHV